MTFVSPVKTQSDGQGRFRVTSRRRRPPTDAATNTPFSPTVMPPPHANTLVGCSQRQSLLTRNAVVTDVLGTQEVVDGSLLALAIAICFSLLQQRRRDDRPEPPPLTTAPSDSLSQSNNTTASYVFDSWKEMSRPENYVYYNNKVKRKRTRSAEPPVKREKTWVVVALLVLFIPIFSAEFFLALSRQVLCGGNPITQSSWAAELCSPHFV